MEYAEDPDAISISIQVDQSTCEVDVRKDFRKFNRLPAESQEQFLQQVAERAAAVFAQTCGVELPAARPAKRTKLKRVARTADPRQRLIRKFEREMERDEPVVVPLAEYFDGNNDPESIPPNNFKGLPLKLFKQVLKRIASRDDVQAVLVVINECPYEDEEGWPTSDTVIVLTSASQDQVAKWTAKLQPDGLFAGWPGTMDAPEGRKPASAPKPKRGMQAYYLTWD